jgi:hypothetical protein
MLRGIGADAGAGPLFALDIGLARRIIADKDDGQVGRAMARGDEGFDLSLHFIAKRIGEAESVHRYGFDRA